MKHKKHILTSFMLILTLLLTGFTSRAVQAETPDEYEFSGIVETVGEDGFTFLTEDDILISVSAIEEDEEGNFFFTLTIGNEDPFTISVDEEFDFGLIEEGGEFELEVKFNEDTEEWTVYKHKFEEKEQEREREEDGYFCSEDSEDHPVALAIAETYEATYDEVIAMFCDGQGEEGSARTGFGQIMLAYQTAEETGGTASEILSERAEGKGWGQIWQELDLIGKPEDAGKPDHAGKPDDVGKPEGVGNGKPEGKGKPDHAGPKH